MSQPDLYFVAVVPPEPVLSEVRAFKEEIRDRFDSRRALRSPAHITLYPPFRLERSDTETIHDQLRAISEVFKPFEIELSGFGCFRPRVIFVQPVESDHLRALQREVATRINPLTKASYDLNRRFHPHMTIGFRDLTKENFGRAWKEFETRDYRRTVRIADIALLKLEPDGWIILTRFPLKGKKV